MASDNIDVGKSSWPKWLFALMIGAPVTVGIGYYYFRKKKTIEEESLDRNGTIKKKVKTKESLIKPDNNEESKVEIVPQTPLEKAQNLKNSGNEFYKKSKFEDALRCYSEAISICPSHEKQQLATFYQNRAATHEVMNNMQGVLEDCGKAIELNPSYMKALSRRLKAAEKVGQLRSALEDVTALCILEHFENLNTLNHADRILKKLGTELAKEAMKTRPPISPSKIFITSYLKTFVNDPLTRSMDQFPSEIEKGKTALENGKLDEAVVYITEWLKSENAEVEKGEEHYLGLLLRGTCLFLMGKTSQALEDLATIIDDKPPFPKIVVNALVKRASANLQLDDLPKCLEDFSKADSIDPSNSDIYNQRAQVYLYSEKLEEAAEDYDKVVDLSPDFGLGILQRLYTKYRRAASSRDAEGIAEATAQLAAAAERHSEIPEGFLLLGQVYADQQNFEAAKTTFNKARAQNPQNANVLTHEALLELQSSGNVVKAIQNLEEAIQLDSKCEFAYETLASIEVQRGNLVRAVELFSKALALAKCEKEMSHICSLKVAAEAQQVVAKRLGLPNGIQF